MTSLPGMIYVKGMGIKLKVIIVFSVAKVFVLNVPFMGSM